jgi:hypothetical protein
MALKLFSFALATSTLLPPITAQNASQAYIYGYAPVAVARIRNSQFCQLNGTEATNVLLRNQHLATPSSSSIVAPNVDTLYGTAWLDLRDGPVVLSIPNITAEPRYFVFQTMNFYT